MSGLNIVPDLLAGASGNLEQLGSGLRSANAAAASQTTAIAAPAADEVSAAITRVFGAYGREFQAVGARAAAFHDKFVSLLNGGAARYVSAELTNAQQALAGATGASAVHPAEAITNNIQNLNYSLGPLQVSLAQTAYPLPGGGIFAASTGGISLNTRFGSTTLLSGSASTVATFNGPFAISVAQTTPLGTLGSSVSGTFTGSTGLQFTGLTVLANGVQFSYPGSLLGFIPNVRVVGV